MKDVVIVKRATHAVAISVFEIASIEIVTGEEKKAKKEAQAKENKPVAALFVC